jgi:hypothetical protein
VRASRSKRALRPLGEDDLGVVYEPVDHRGGDDGVAEDLSPANWNWHTFIAIDPSL